jgi:HEPN domain-containing protein
MDITRQISYWEKGSISDIETAEILLAGKKYLEGLFFCHLSIEKILKALVVKENHQLAPKSHNLHYLSELARVIITDEQAKFMSVLMKYQLEGRYPEYYPGRLSEKIVQDYFQKTKGLFECLRQML